MEKRLNRGNTFKVYCRWNGEYPRLNDFEAEVPFVGGT